MTELAVTVEDIRNTLVNAISVEFGIAPNQLATDRSFTEYGVDSLGALAVAMELEDTYGLVDLPPTLLWDYPTVDTLAPRLLTIMNGQLVDAAARDPR